MSIRRTHIRPSALCTVQENQNAIPSLHHLSSARGAATEVHLQLFQRRDGKRVANENVTTEPRRVHDPDESSASVGYRPGPENLADIINKLLVPESLMAHKWRVAIRNHLLAKNLVYDKLISGVKAELGVQRGERMEYAKLSRKTFEGGGSTRPGQTQQNKSNWDLMNEDGGLDEWKSAYSAWRQYDEIQNAATIRLADMADDAKWREHIVAFCAELRELFDYRTKPVMLDQVAQRIRAFIRAPSVAESMMFNVMIMGKPGTGKTRLARLFGSVFSKLGMYAYDEFEEVDYSDFVAEYEGQTVPKTKRLLTNQLERVTFLDEAYVLATWDADHTTVVGYSREAINTIVPFLSDNAGSMCMIVAGYRNEMLNDFLPTNPGLERRFPIRISLDEYPPGVMFDIFIEALAKTFLPKKPSKPMLEAKELQVRTWFTDSALDFFHDVVRLSRRRVNIDTAAIAEESNRKEREENEKAYETAKAVVVQARAALDAARAGSSFTQQDAAPMQTTEGTTPDAGPSRVDPVESAARALTIAESDERKAAIAVEDIKQKQDAAKKQDRKELKYKYEWLARMFEAQAGAMTNFASTVSVMLAAHPSFEQLGERAEAAMDEDDGALGSSDTFAVGFEDMYLMLIEWMREQFGFLVRNPGDVRKRSTTDGTSDSTATTAPAAPAQRPPAAQGGGAKRKMASGLSRMLGGGDGSVPEAPPPPSLSSAPAQTQQMEGGVSGAEAVRSGTSAVNSLKTVKDAEVMAYDVAEAELNRALADWWFDLTDDGPVWKRTPASDAARREAESAYAGLGLLTLPTDPTTVQLLTDADVPDPRMHFATDEVQSAVAKAMEIKAERTRVADANKAIVDALDNPQQAQQQQQQQQQQQARRRAKSAPRGSAREALTQGFQNEIDRFEMASRASRPAAVQPRFADPPDTRGKGWRQMEAASEPRRSGRKL